MEWRSRVAQTVEMSRETAVDVHAEITANVWQVRVEVGQSVAVGDDLVILESMKMEIPVEAPIAGTVAEIRVQPDTQVQEGDVVAVIDEP
jgi:urea carboxylase